MKGDIDVKVRIDQELLDEEIKKAEQKIGSLLNHPRFANSLIWKVSICVLIMNIISIFVGCAILTLFVLN